MAVELIEALRVCSKCREAKLETAEYFPRWKGGPQGLTRECRSCRKAYMKARYARNPEPTKARSQAERDAKPKCQGPPIPAGMKVCRKCWSLKLADRDHFVLDTHYDPPRPCSPCRECHNQENARRKKQEPEKLKRQADNYRERGRQNSRKWRRANPERNKALNKANYHKRRRATKGKPNFSADDIQKQKASQKSRCWWCQCLLDAYEVDHRIPVSRGGPNTADNIVISCRPCNRSKSARMPWEMDNPRLL